MQSKTAYFAPVTPRGELDETFWSIRSVMWKQRRHQQNRKYITYCVAVRGLEQDRATAAGNMYRKFVEVWRCGNWHMRADRQTNRQTRWPPYFASDRTTWWIREAVKIRQEAQDVMNRDEAVFLLSHVYDDLYYSPLRQLQRLIAESYQFEKGDSCCRNVTNFR